MDDISKRHLELRDEHAGHVRSILDRYGIETVAESGDPRAKLRAWQRLVSGTDTAVRDAAEALGVSAGVVAEYWREIGHLRAAGVFSHLGYHEEGMTLLSENKTLLSLASSVGRFFANPPYAVPQSERFVVPVFADVPWRVALDILARRIAGHRPAFRLVGEISGRAPASRDVSVVYGDGFEEAYEARRKFILRSPVHATVYALVGVHGGRDTHESDALELLARFGELHRLPLLFTEGLALYIAHPDFLLERGRATLFLGEECAGKHVHLAFDAETRTLTVSLMTIDAIRRSGLSGTLSPVDYSAGKERTTCGKPSAGAIILP